MFYRDFHLVALFNQDLVDEASDDRAVDVIQNGLIDLTQLELLSVYPRLREFVSTLLVADPSKRSQGHNIRSHAYFSDFSQNEWIAINMKQRPPFRNDKQVAINPRNTSYDYADRPGEGLLSDANEDIVNRWFAEDGIGMPHHRDSEYHRRHRDNARVGLPYRASRRVEESWEEEPLGPRSI